MLDSTGGSPARTVPRVRRAPVVLLGAYALLAVAEVVGLVAVSPLAHVADLSLMPVLAAFVLVSTRQPRALIVWTVVAIALSWAGDNTGGIALKIGLFLPAQLAYAAGFWRYRHQAPFFRRPVLIGFGFVLLGLIALSAANAGPLAVPVAAYGLCLGLMVVTASGVDRLSGLGAILFLLSDVVLALDVFVAPGLVPAGDVVNQLLYLPGQALIAIGVVRRAGAGATTGRAAP